MRKRGTADSHRLRLYIAIGACVFVLALVGSLLVSAQVSGATAARQLLDPGVLVRCTLPVARTLVNLSLASLLGTLMLAMWALTPGFAEYRRAMNCAWVSAAILTLSSCVTLFTSFLDAAAIPISFDDHFTEAFIQFAFTIPLGQLWCFEIVFGAITTVLCAFIQTRKLTLLPCIIAFLAIQPLAEQGHAAGASGHELALGSMFLHILGMAMWMGALMGLVCVVGKLEKITLTQLMHRYSALALYGSLLLAISGIVSAMLRLNEPGELFETGYGWLLVGKSGTLVVLLGFGAFWRLRAIPKLVRTPKSASASSLLPTVKLVLVELAIMAVATGVAGALGRSEPPKPNLPLRDTLTEVTPAEWLTGDKLPPEPNALTPFALWDFDIIWVVIPTLAIILYLYGVYRLYRRGVRWPIGRTVAWISGMLLLFYTANGFLQAYSHYVFSLHMLGHMFFTMAIPMVLVLGAPMTLLLRVAHPRKDGSWGLREWAMWLVETPYSRILTHPIISACIFAGSLWIFYFTPVLRWAMAEHIGHEWMIIHFLLSGYFFALAMVGVDPIPFRFSYPLRLVTLLATMAAHAFFGITIMMSTGLLAADWFGAMGRTWGDTPLLDQQNGGGIAWGIGEFPTLLLTIIVAVQWARSDEREQRRKDRAADRFGDEELRAYNEMLRQHAIRDKSYADAQTGRETVK